MPCVSRKFESHSIALPLLFSPITRAACPLYGFLFQAQSQNKEDEEQSYLQLELEVVYLGKGLACCGRRREGNKYL